MVNILNDTKMAISQVINRFLNYYTSYDFKCFQKFLFDTNFLQPDARLWEQNKDKKKRKQRFINEEKTFYIIKKKHFPHILEKIYTIVLCSKFLL